MGFWSRAVYPGDLVCMGYSLVGTCTFGKIACAWEEP